MTRGRGAAPPIILGIDGGNSKVDAAFASMDGALLAAARDPTVSHQQAGLAPGMSRLDEMVRAAAEAAGLSSQPPFADLVVASLAGADYPSDIRLLQHALDGLGIAQKPAVVVNDTIGALRAGASRSWGVALVCGQGVNASAIAPDGRTAGFPAVGDIAGDWGGGGSVGMAGLRAAVRGRDGRGPRTSLERSVPAFFGLARPGDVTRGLYERRFDDAGVSQLSPLVFEEARVGDAVARAIVDQLATELAAMTNALVRRLHLTRLEVEVILAGGVFRTDEPGFYRALERQIRTVTPRATLVHLKWPPVTGAVLLGLDRLIASDAAAEPGARLAVATARLRRSLGTWDRDQLASTS